MNRAQALTRAQEVLFWTCMVTWVVLAVSMLLSR